MTTPVTLEKAMKDLEQMAATLALASMLHGRPPEKHLFDNVSAYITQQAERLRVANEAIAVRDDAISSLVDFGYTVAGSSSYWDETWPLHDAALAAQREG